MRIDHPSETQALDDNKDNKLAFTMPLFQRVIKRCFDICFAFTGLVVLSPLYLILVILLMIGGGGRVFYRQERMGRHGRLFSILKFRTMKADAEADVPKLEMPGDPRLTRIGRYLRRHHLDELPQLWNVLKGDMSVVGPRPERPYFVCQIQEQDARYPYLFQLRPGLTSEATLVNGYANSIEKMVKRLDIDLQYLSKATLYFDFKLILRTALLVLQGDRTNMRVVGRRNSWQKRGRARQNAPSRRNATTYNATMTTAPQHKKATAWPVGPIPNKQRICSNNTIVIS